ncbi:hypothetical protein ICL29_004071 [Salmonella enterica]|nr:hypothetical protein [Salmonella enterica]EHK5999347.1 hypothetical protein [Salmonella enterica]EIF5124566.1 hypothetical protein [Salmonella enterica]EIF5348742.1 hypothetical protein [Salmonella enterica]EIF5657339.1 hypothetical protein [Salmonella enterica]
MNKYITKSDAIETGAVLNSQFQLGDYVTFTPDSVSEPGETVIRGWVVAVTFTASRVYYTVAEDSGSDLCRIHENLRCYMRRESDGEETDFLRFEAVKELFESPLLDGAELPCVHAEDGEQILH